MGSFVRPTLVENEIAKRIKNGLVQIGFRLLPDMRMVAVDDIGAGID